jgi:hypothetical protein
MQGCPGLLLWKRFHLLKPFVPGMYWHCPWWHTVLMYLRICISDFILINHPAHLAFSCGFMVTKLISHTQAHTHAHPRPITCTHPFHACVHACARTRAHICMRAHTHTHTHTHTHRDVAQLKMRIPLRSPLLWDFLQCQLIYQSILHYIPEEQRPHLCCDRSLKWHKNTINYKTLSKTLRVSHWHKFSFFGLCPSSI